MHTVAAPAPLKLEALAEPLSVCRLPADAVVPEGVLGAIAPGGFCSVTRTADELSIICPTSRVPADAGAAMAREDGWRALKLVGPFAFSEVGVLLRVAAPLAAASISILPVATFDTDYVLVPESAFTRALAELEKAGHTVTHAG